MDRRAPIVALVVWVAVAPVLWGSVAEVGKPGEGLLSTFRAAGGSYAVFRLLGYGALALLIPSLLGRFGGDTGTRTGARMLILALILIATAAFQLVPLPVGIYSLLAPGHARDLAVLLPERAWSPISTDPGLTGRAVVHLFLMLAAALAVYHTVRTPKRAWILLGTIFGVAALGALYGMYESHIGHDTVFGQAKGRAGGGVTGTFFYRGNFAAFTAAGLGMATVAMIRAFRSGRRLHTGLAGVAVLVTGLALVLSNSRAGLLAGGLALALAVLLSLRSRRMAWAGVAAIVVLGAGVMIGVPSLRERMTYVSGEGSRGHADIRLPAWVSSLRLAASRPVLGSGFGTYRRAIHLTQSEDIPRELYYAHSDPFNVLAEGGAFGLLVVVTLGIMGFMVALRLSRDREQEGSGAAAACVAGLAGLIVMACLDFPLQIPATSLVFAALLFMPAALRAPGIPEPRGGGARLALARFAAIAGFALLLVGVIEDYRHGLVEPGALTVGEVRYERGRRRMADGDYEAARDEFAAARELQPFEASTRIHLAQTHYRLAEVEAARREVRAAWRVARGRAAICYSVGRFSLLDRTLGDLTVEACREASVLEAKFFPEIMKLDRLSPAELLDIVPDHPHLLKNLARYLAGKGHAEEADEARRRAAAAGS